MLSVEGLTELPRDGHYQLMSDDYKKRIQASIEKFHKRELNQSTVVKRKNNKPEAKIENEIYKHLNSIGWSIDFYESSTFGINPEYQDYKVRPGHSDLAGNLPNGIACYIEVKNTGRRSTLSDNQRQFLIDKINTNCFAVVADSLSYVLNTFETWQNSQFKKAYLLKELPPERTKGKQEDFDPDMGF